MKRIAIALLACSLALPAIAQMKGMDASPEKAAAGAAHNATGVVTKVDPAAGKLTIKHGPVESLKWPAMTMTFKAKDKAMLSKVKKDQKISFTFIEQGKDYVVTEIR